MSISHAAVRNVKPETLTTLKPVPYTQHPKPLNKKHEKLMRRVESRASPPTLRPPKVWTSETVQVHLPR